MGFYIGSILCTVHDIIISNVMCPNKFHVQDMKNPCLRRVPYVQDKLIHIHNYYGRFKGFTKTLKLVIVLSLNFAQIEHTEPGCTNHNSVKKT